MYYAEEQCYLDSDSGEEELIPTKKPKAEVRRRVWKRAFEKTTQQPTESIPNETNSDKEASQNELREKSFS